jgi:hypothetical protein
MSLTTVAELKSVLGIGSLVPDATLQEVCDASDAVLLPMLWANKEFNQGHSNTTNTGTLYFDQPHGFIAGQQIVVAGNGSKHNGSKTITGVSEYTITYAISGNNNTASDEHLVIPYGSVTGETYQDWTTDSAIQQASLMLSVDIFQARSVPSSGGVAIDGSASPWRMSNSLLAKIRGLIAHALDPRSMVG